MINIFFSYASSDSAIVLRTYNDLARAQESRIWCYEIDGRPGLDFRKQYLQSIKKADFLLLFDSPAARDSKFVREETAEWYRLRKNNPILPCLAVPSGNWRDQNQLFGSQNTFSFIDLTDYAQGIKKLHQSLGTILIPSFTKPRDQEFADELATLRPNLGADNYRQALQHYQTFEETHAYNPDLALSHLEVMINEIKTVSGLSIGSALLALADDYFTLNRFDSAIRIFTQVCKHHPQDPRGWAGLGFTQVKQEKFSDATQSFHTSLEAIDKSDRTTFHEQRIEIANALCGALILVTQYDLARSLVESEIRSLRANAVTYGFGARLLLLAGKLEKACELLAEATARIVRGEHVDPPELIDLIDVARQLKDKDDSALDVFSLTAVRLFPDNPRILRDAAAAQSDLGNLKTAMTYLEQARMVDQKNLRINVELGLLLKKCKRQAEANELLEETLEHIHGAGDKTYYIGLAHYLLGRRECAKFFLASARYDENVANWPDYKDACD